VEEETGRRVDQLRDKLAGEEFDTLMVLQQENRRYLSGFTGEDGQCDESAGALFITAEELLLATDSRYETQARTEAPQFEIYRYEKGLTKEIPAILGKLRTKRLAFESVRIPFLWFQELEKELKEAGLSVPLIPTKDLVENLRLTKSPEEVHAIRRSLALCEAVFERLLKELLPGPTEKELAWAIEKGLREEGAEALAFPPIVASGPNAALPHAVPGNRVIGLGEPILFDWGARLNGYCSDISRTILLGDPDPTFKKVYQVVKDAQAKAVEAMRAGVSTKAVDEVARNHIGDQGFGDRFGHGLGHGVGLAVHEGPRLSPLRPMVLEAGMVTTVEPGIYIPGWGGVRLENMVVVQEGGAMILNKEPLIGMMAF
jgi:Xaa-Pro aminopeptidase